MNISNRDPYSSLKYENEFTLSGFKRQQKRPYSKPTHMAQTEEPWSHLHDTATWSSFKRSAMYHQGPQDSLDFKLQASYDHHKDFLCTKNQIVHHSETDSEEHRNAEKQVDKETEENQDIRRWIEPQRISIHSIK